MTLAPRTLLSVAIPKPKISLQFLFRRGVWGEPAKNGKEIFGFGSDASFLQKGLVFIFLALWRYFVRPFLRHSRRCEALPVSAFGGNSSVRSHFAPPRIGRSHSLTMPARCCFVFAPWLRLCLW